MESLLYGLPSFEIGLSYFDSLSVSLKTSLRGDGEELIEGLTLGLICSETLDLIKVYLTNKL